MANENLAADLELLNSDQPTVHEPIDEQTQSDLELLNQSVRVAPTPSETSSMPEEQFQQQFESQAGLDESRILQRDHPPPLPSLEEIRGPDFLLAQRENTKAALKRTIKTQFGVEDADVQVDFDSGMDLLDRANLSLKETPEEKLAAFREMYKKGWMGYIKVEQPPVANPDQLRQLTGSQRQPFELVPIFKTDITDPNEPFKVVDPKGLDMGDAADMAGTFPELTLSAITAYLTSGQSLTVQALGQAGSVVTAGAVEELAEEVFTESQLESPTDIGLRLTEEGGMAALFAYGFGFIGKTAAKNALGKNDEMIDRFEQILADKDIKARLALQGMDESDLREMLLTTELASLGDNPLFKALTSQAKSSIRTFKERLEKSVAKPLEQLDQMRNYGAQMRAVKDEQGNVLRYRPLPPSQAQKQVQKGLQRLYHAETGRGLSVVKNRPRLDVPAQQGQKQWAKALENWEKSSGRRVSARFNVIGRLEKMHQNQTGQPFIYDLTNLKQTANAIRTKYFTQTRNQETGEFNITLGEELDRNMLRVLDKINAMDPKMVGFERIDALRKEVGELYEAGIKSGLQGKRVNELYAAATNTADAPINVPVNSAMGKGYRGAYDTAKATANARFDVMSMDAFKRQLNSENFGQVIEQWAKPGGIDLKFIEQVFDNQNLKRLFRTNELELLRASVRSQILAQENPLEVMAKMKAASNAQYKVIFPDETAAQPYRRAAQALQELKASPLAKAAEQTAPGKAVRALFNGNFERKDIYQLVRSLNKDGREALRATMLDDYADAVVKTPTEKKIAISGLDKYNAQAAATKIKQYHEMGWWDSGVLSKQDKEAMKFHVDYLSRAAQLTEDMGTNLELHQMVSQLKQILNPFQAAAGGSKMLSNKITATALQSPTIRKLLLRMKEAKQPLSVQASQSTGTLLGALISEVKTQVDREADGQTPDWAQVINRAVEQGLMTMNEAERLRQEAQANLR